MHDHRPEVSATSSRAEDHKHQPAAHEGHAPDCCSGAAHARGTAAEPSGRRHDHAHDEHAGDAHGDGESCASDGDTIADAALPEAIDGYRRLRISGMDCASCANTIRTAVGGMAGVSDVRVSVTREMMSVALDETKTPLAAVRERVESLGYGAELLTEDAPARRPVPVAWWRTFKGLHAIVGGAATALSFAVSHFSPQMGHWMFIAAAILLALPFARRAFAAASAGAPFTIEMLMTIAVIGAVLIGEPAEATVVVFLFASGEVLEAYAAGRARAGIQALASLVPDRAFIEEDGVVREIPASEIRPGQIVLARPGDHVAADGTVVEGRAHLDEAAITGESVPVSRGLDEKVFAGSIVLDAALKIRAEKTASDNTIARIVQLVEEAQDAKAPAERFIDAFSRIYTPLVAALGLLVAVIPPLFLDGDWDTWIYRGLALLLIGCPCALVISVPAAVASALSSSARAGILVKGGVILETIAKADVVAFDKTGTLTKGKPAVTEVHAVEAGADELLALASAIEAGSNHPLAEAIVAEAKAKGLVPVIASGVKALAGRGVSGSVNGRTIFIGAPRFAAEEGKIGPALADRIKTMQQAGNTIAVIIADGVGIGAIALRDEPRDDTREGIEALRALGIETVMLSGDNPATAAAIGRALSIDDARGGLLPADKVNALKAMSQKRGVVMVGDGINDAAALAAASVGMAMGSGTGLARETAGVALMGNRVVDVARVITLGRATMANIRQNVAIALGLKAVFLVTTIFGITGLWIAVFADTGATVLVTLNAMRLLLPGAGAIGAKTHAA
ncbi:heavy metal-(Cd/Co/Hg/Pb/Zn)-translocating P-type ATPase [Rhizobium subbaraonis]|uniref:P-type Zn(2+) transporter n=1 Tax=Rhizobium subbaraonis TaxID=908946 RepID=A0A285U1Y3_9HYPH|nr:heavy metal translocating P-type ATPase [Rhizobium subbaraonis]SOC35832.1 heavy metal-(Cd/Co/Hg/Pb/Zn)-translocating P-type ATPase [Rhizobium subbaraonis]